jgi:periplasmic protein CpxP/Spy
MKNRSTLVIAAIIAGSALVLSGCGRGHHEGSPEKRVEKGVKGISWMLDFDKDQKAKLDVIKKDVIAKIKEEKPNREATHKEALELVKKDSLDRAAVIAFIDKQIGELNRNKTFIADKIVEFHAILTPAQKKKIVEHMEDRMKDNN